MTDIFLDQIRFYIDISAEATGLPACTEMNY